MKTKKFWLFFILVINLVLISPYLVFADIDSLEDETIHSKEENTTDVESDINDELSDNQSDNFQDEESNNVELEDDDEAEKINADTKIKSETDTDSPTEKNDNQSETINLQSNVLKNGVSNSRVKELKVNLAKLGFAVPGNGTIHFRDETEKRVKEFQDYYKLNVDGIAGRSTLENIDEILSTPLQNGKRHQSTVQLKKELAELGYPVPGNETNYYGKDTTKKVKEFQTDYGLAISGIAEEVTLAKIEELLDKDDSLSNGSYHSDVVILKEDLKKLGFEVPGKGTPLFGPKTEEKVEQFQAYYDLEVTGVADESTLSKIDDILSSPLQTGNRHRDTVQLKKNLATIGYRVPGNGTNYYGKDTTKKVKELQADYALAISGIAEEVTLAKIQDLLDEPLSNGSYHSDVIILKENLKKLGFEVPGKGTPLFGPKTEEKVEEFQAYYNLEVTGVADDLTLLKIDEILSTPLQYGKRHKDTVQLKEDLAFLGYPVPGNGTTLYGEETEKKVKEFQSKYNLVINGIADEIVLSKIQELLEAPMSNGLYRMDVVTLKENLKKLGFEVPGNGTPLFGSKTEKKVKQFQSYYDLEITGIADDLTLTKIDEILSNPLQFGKRHEDTIQLKKDLAELGYPVPGNETNYYGKQTTEKVKDFQADHGLIVNGIVDKPTAKKINKLLSEVLSFGDRHEDVIQLKKDLDTLGFKVTGNGTNYYGKKTQQKVKEFQIYYGLSVTETANAATLVKINEILSSPLQYGKRHKDTVQLKKDLASLGYPVPGDGTNYYGKKTADKVKSFQKDYGLAISGIADEVTLAKISEAVAGLKYTRYDLTLDQAVNIQLKASPQTDRKYAYVSSSYIDKNDRVTASTLNVRKGAGTAYKIVGSLKKGDKVSIISEHNGWYVIDFKGTDQWVNARPEDVRYYLDPNNFIHDEKQQFQFLDLSKPSGASKTVLNNYLKGKGILAGRAQAFIDGGRQNGINDVYLISHATLETGNGSSELANGIEVGKNKSGKLVLVTKSNRGSLTNIKKVYNMYGIGAYDDCAKECGAKRAYEEGWTTPDKAIVGGAKFIDNYINRGQNTLYKMRWDPAAMESTGSYGRQYATDIGWASKQINTMYNLYQSIGSYKLTLDIPDYK